MKNYWRSEMKYSSINNHKKSIFISDERDGGGEADHISNEKR
jgi:hypothetical protein